MKQYVIAFLIGCVTGFPIGFAIQFQHQEARESDLACELRIGKFLTQTEKAVNSWEKCQIELENIKK